MNYLTKESRVRIGLRIRQARKQAGLSHDRLGDLVGTSRQHLIKLEKGKHAPREDMLQRIADATGKTLAFFTQDEEEDEVDDGEAEVVSLDDLIRRRVEFHIRRALANGVAERAAP
jgi:transcriptional regulator with XRE-family HTH domain